MILCQRIEGEWARRRYKSKERNRCTLMSPGREISQKYRSKSQLVSLAKSKKTRSSLYNRVQCHSVKYKESEQDPCLDVSEASDRAFSALNILQPENLNSKYYLINPHTRNRIPEKEARNIR